jgi:hypothetical protein
MVTAYLKPTTNLVGHQAAHDLVVPLGRRRDQRRRLSTIEAMVMVWAFALRVEGRRQDIFRKSMRV